MERRDTLPDPGESRNTLYSNHGVVKIKEESQRERVAGILNISSRMLAILVFLLNIWHIPMRQMLCSVPEHYFISYHLKTRCGKLYRLFCASSGIIPTKDSPKGRTKG